MTNTIIVAYSQQKSNTCKAGDTEWAHTKIIGQKMFDILKRDGLLECKLMADSQETLDKQRLIDSVKEINKAAKETSDIKNTYCVMVHTNATGNDTIGKGAECIYYPGNDKTKTMGIRVVKELSSIGLKERAVYSNKSLHALNSTVCNALIVEAGFHDNESEALWIHLNLENIAKAIVRGIYTALDIKFPETTVIEKWKEELKTIRTGLQKWVEEIDKLLK
jgi:N-acetylmuramoyl-L-alanine amidase